MKHHILMFFTALSMAHSDALNLLASSTIFVPSLITHIAYLARPVWEEEDEESFESQFKPASLYVDRDLIFSYFTERESTATPGPSVRFTKHFRSFTMLSSTPHRPASTFQRSFYVHL